MDFIKIITLDYIMIESSTYYGIIVMIYLSN